MSTRMRIAVTADLHYDLAERDERGRAEIARLVALLRASKPDALVLAGDTVGLGWAHLEAILRRLTAVAPNRLIVFGNHEYWSADRRTWPHLDRLAKVISTAGFHLLDRSPVVMDGVAFVGNCGWYDYSLAPPSAPHGGSYEKKRLGGLLVCNDGALVDLGCSDAAHAETLRIRLERDIASVSAKARTVVAVTHHIAFPDMLPPDRDDQTRFGRAFDGSAALGALLVRYPQVSHHFCGHTHRAARVARGQLASINVGSDYDQKRFEVVEV
jgi:3',5'-cyclic AMP phosphodiesterase CpdA